MRSLITTRVHDANRGCPAAGVPVLLEVKNVSGEWIKIARGETDYKGEVTEWLAEGTKLSRGYYRILYDTATYFRAAGVTFGLPYIHFCFEVDDVKSPHHVPLLLSAQGYSICRT